MFLLCFFCLPLVLGPFTEQTQDKYKRKCYQHIEKTRVNPIEFQKKRP